MSSFQSIYLHIYLSLSVSVNLSINNPPQAHGPVSVLFYLNELFKQKLDSIYLKGKWTLIGL